MSSNSFFFILNPAANRGRARLTWGQAQSILDQARIRYEVATTERPGEAVRLAERAALDGWPAVVAVGGDGTIHEVANGLMRAASTGASTALGVIGAGSGNDFIKVLGLSPHRPAEAVRRLLAARPRRLDIGRIGERFFVNGASVGFDARVAIEAQRVRPMRGPAIYLLALIKALRVYRPSSVRLVLDGEEVVAGPVTLVAVTNGRCYGGGFYICPQAQPDDGYLDVCVADPLGTVEILGFVPRVMRGSHVGRREVRMFRARQVVLRSADPVPVQADGEIVAHDAHEVEFSLLPGGLTVLA